jgi:hypothetical protein
MSKPQDIDHMELWAWVHYDDCDKRMDFLHNSNGIAVYLSEEQARRHNSMGDDDEWSLVCFTAEFIARDGKYLEARDD